MSKYTSKIARKKFEKTLDAALEVLKAEILSGFEDASTEATDAYDNAREDGTSHKEAKDDSDNLFTETITSVIEEKIGEFRDDMDALIDGR